MKNCAALVVWGMMFLLACLQTVPLGLFGSPFSKDLFPKVKNEFTVAEGEEVRPTQEWLDEMAGHRPFFERSDPSETRKDVFGHLVGH